MKTLAFLLGNLTINGLKELLQHFAGKQPVGRKELLVNALCEVMTGMQLRTVWDRLDATQRLAVAEVLYHPLGIFEADKFRAKHGRSPAFHEAVNKTSRYSSYRGRASLLQLFLCTRSPPPLPMPLS